ncbi:hypothetical protein CRYUN_Cryun11dG0009800 [Craigia yunnanensis]
MGKEETKSEVTEPVANGTSLLEKSGEAVAEKTEEENNGVKEMEEDKKNAEKVETEKMDEDQQVKEDKESQEELEKEEKEEPKTEAMEEETDPKENDKKVEKEEIKDEVEEKKEPEQRTPLTDRPVRERKSVERLVASIDKDASREFQIEKGRGTPLKDIPNVAFKLSRRKTDDTFRLLHTVLFGRRGKAVQIKSNISRFSGFVWHDNEEKQKIKVTEKFDKCNKEKLLEFCDVLDIPIMKTTTRKEDIVAKLIDFLEAPHAKTTVLLAEKEKSSKGTKRKRVTKSGTTSKQSTKSRRKSEDTPKLGKKSTPDSEDESEEEEEEEEKEEEQNEEGENENGVTEKSEDELAEDSESEEKNESEQESEEDEGNKKRSIKASSRKKESAGKAITKKVTVPKRSTPQKRTPKTSSSKNSKVGDDSDKSPKVFSRKKPEKVTKEKSSTPTKSASKEKTSKRVAKGKDKAKEKKLKPSDYELRATICEILKEVDFNTATFTDILKLLAQHFDTDLTPRKSSIKLMIQEELTKLADEADDEDGEGDAERDETQSAGKGLKPDLQEGK